MLVDVNGKFITMSAAYLDRMLDPVIRCFTPDVARKLAELRVDCELQARIDTLADTCTEGLLTEEERVEYETYVRAANLISILQAKARRLLMTSGES